MGTPYQRPVSVRRPFASATAALRRGMPAHGRHGAEILKDLLDFQGTVQLAQALDAPAPAIAPGAGPIEDAWPRAQRRLALVEQDVRQPLRDPLAGGPLVSADRIARALAAAGVPATRGRKAIATAAHELFAPVDARTARRIASARAAVLEVRRELAPAIAASGPTAARLEQIDAALAQATAARSDALVGRALAAIGDAIAGDLEREIAALPRSGTSELPLAAWAEGFVAARVGECEALALATFLHERARIEALVRHAKEAR